MAFGDGDATRSLPRDGDVKELRGDPTVGPNPKVWTRGQNVSSAKDGAPEGLTNVSPPQRGGAAPALLTRSGPKWRDKNP